MPDFDKWIDGRFYGDGTVTLLSDFYAYGVTAPAGFNFDGASTPPAFKWLVPKFEKTLKASCRHDYVCRAMAKSDKQRKDADRIFMLMLIDSGFGKIRSQFAYLGVRIGAKLGVGVYY